MKKSCVVILFVLVMPLMMAVSTEVKIKTIPNADDVQMSIYNADSDTINIDERYNGVSDEYGDVSHTFDISYDEFNLILFVKKDGESLISNEKFLDNPSGGMVYLEAPVGNVALVPTPGFENGIDVVEEVAEVVEIVNETENEIEDLVDGEIEEEEINSSTKSIATAFSIFGEGKIFSKKNLYSIGGFFLLIVIVGFVVGVVKKRMHVSPKEINVRKLSELQQEQKQDLVEKKEDIEDYKKEIEDAEKKIKEAQDDINKIRNQEKIKEMKKKLEEDQKELERLGGASQ